MESIGALEALGLEGGDFYCREACVISAGPAKILFTAYQGWGDPSESNPTMALVDQLAEHTEVLAAIGFSSDPGEFITKLIQIISDQRYLQGRIDSGNADVSISLTTIPALTNEAAESLSKHQGDLLLDGLTKPFQRGR